MAVFKCKMCGGTLEINNETVAICQYCGTKQTLPKLDDDCKANLYDRANHFRRNNEFDKAMGIYEQILNDDNSDAETYWSLVLCRYGIEYVEDPATRKRIPTVNRAQFTSVFDDEDYKSALKYADGYQKEIYEQEAKVINDIQKGILAISSQEDPFDVFICYKESDANGRRTPDSVLATELYHELVREGYKVFFSRITLEDKLGSAYEPYIFAALNSAKVMVVLGTKSDHFNAVWVKNEWRRYLALIKNGARKMLIPAYKDMDPYDLPEEFSHLQAQDMSKLGFMQDLIRGIKKIVEADNTKQTIRETIITNDNAGGNVNALLKRGFMALEDGEWTKADDFFEQCLNQNAELAEAYLGKLMAELQIRTQDGLKNCEEPFNDKSNYQKTIRFANNKLKVFLTDTIKSIDERNKLTALNEVYIRAQNLMNLKQESAYIEAKAQFESIVGFRDADELAIECGEKAEKARKDSIYNSAIKDAESDFIPYLESAIKKFDSIIDWKDSATRQSECTKILEKLRLVEKQKQEEEAREAELRKLEEKHQEEIKKIEQDKKKKKIIKLVKIVIPIAFMIVAVLILLFTVIIPKYQYDKAVKLMNEGAYVSAVDEFLKIGEYKDSVKLTQECIYLISTDLIQQGKDSEAMQYLDIIDDFKYKDSEELLLKCKQKILQNADIGDTIVWGEYEQDCNKENGKERVEWIVLAKKTDKLLVISRYALDCQPFQTKITGEITWDNSSIRKWLHEDFLNDCFSDNEKQHLYESSGNNKIVLLTKADVNKYFDSDSKRKCQATPYAISQGAETHDDNTAWWLSTLGTYTNAVCLVSSGGSTYTEQYANYKESIRPAVWINFSPTESSNNSQQDEATKETSTDKNSSQNSNLNWVPTDDNPSNNVFLFYKILPNESDTHYRYLLSIDKDENSIGGSKTLYYNTWRSYEGGRITGRMLRDQPIEWDDTNKVSGKFTMYSKSFTFKISDNTLTIVALGEDTDNLAGTYELALPE